MATRLRFTREFLETLSKSELIEIILSQQNTIDALEKRVEALELRLGMNSTNSSKPPSSNGPQTPPPPPRKKSKKKRGAQPGHEGHIRAFLPPDQVNEVIDHKPRICRRCGNALHGEDPNPSRHQQWEIPPLAPVVTEHRLHVLTCSCGAVNVAKMPESVGGKMFGPALTGLASTFTGVFHVSRRASLEIINTVFNVPMSLGGLSACEAEASVALAPAVEEIRKAVLQSPVAHADETSFRLGNKKKGWLWVVIGGGLAYFLLQASRGIAGAKGLLGDFTGVLVTDRWDGYNRHTGPRQYCWAHVKRDFVRISEMSGEAGAIGDSLLRLEGKLFKKWRRVRDGTLARELFSEEIIPLRRQLGVLLRRGCKASLLCSGMCRELLRHENRLWTFAEHPNMEPTNNLAERTIRPAVLWRKTSFGVQSERGRLFAGRMMTITASCRMQGVGVVNFIKESITAFRTKEQQPSLIKKKTLTTIAS